MEDSLSERRLPACGSVSQNSMQQDLIVILEAVKYSAIALAALTVTGIVTLMFISWDKDEDITGVVAPALLITIISTITAIVAAILQKTRGENGRTYKGTVTEHEEH